MDETAQSGFWENGLCPVPPAQHCRELTATHGRLMQILPHPSAGLRDYEHASKTRDTARWYFDAVRRRNLGKSVEDVDNRMRNMAQSDAIAISHGCQKGNCGSGVRCP